MVSDQKYCIVSGQKTRMAARQSWGPEAQKLRPKFRVWSPTGSTTRAVWVIITDMQQPVCSRNNRIEQVSPSRTSIPENLQWGTRSAPIVD